MVHKMHLNSLFPAIHKYMCWWRHLSTRKPTKLAKSNLFFQAVASLKQNLDIDDKCQNFLSNRLQASNQFRTQDKIFKLVFQPVASDNQFGHFVQIFNPTGCKRQPVWPFCTNF